MGLWVVGYMNSWGTYVSEAHSEWNVVNSRGQSMRDTSRYGNPCINSGYADYFLGEVAEVCSLYEIDGLWVDMVEISFPVCFCPACKTKFREKYGKEIPEIIDWNNSDFVSYIRFKGESLTAYARKIRETALSIKPELSVAMQCAIFVRGNMTGVNNEAYFQYTDYCSGDFYTDRHGVIAISRVLYKLTKEQPFEFMTSRCVRLRYHTMEKNANDILRQAYASIMYNGAFLFIDAIHPSGELNTDFYKRMAEVTRQLKPYQKYFNDSEKALRDVAVYFNFDSLADSEDNGKSVDIMTSDRLFNRIKNIVKSLTQAHIDCDIISRKNLDELKNYKVVILSSLEMMSAEEAEAIRQYIAGGGKAYISGRTSLRDNLGNLKKDFMLGDVLGLEYRGGFEVSPCYIAPSDRDEDLFGIYNARYPLMIFDRLFKLVSKPDSKVLATVTLPISDKSDTRVFSSAISNPPMVQTDRPAVVSHRYGQGEVIYSAALIEESDLDGNLCLFNKLISRLLGERRIMLNGPSCVDYTVYRGKQYLKIALLNTLDCEPIVEINSIEIQIRLEAGEKIRIVYRVDGEPVKAEVVDHTLKIRTSLTMFAMILVELE